MLNEIEELRFRIDRLTNTIRGLARPYRSSSGESRRATLRLTIKCAQERLYLQRQLAKVQESLRKSSVAKRNDSEKMRTERRRGGKEVTYFVRLAFLAIPWESKDDKNPRGTLFKH